MDDDDYDIGALLGGPIRAIQDAQIAAEQQYMEFLLDYGLEEVSKKVGNKTETALKLREISFGMTKAVSDPESPGQMVETEAQVRAPLLSLVQMPAVGIEQATIELSLDVRTDTTEKETEKPSSATERFAPKMRIARPVLKGAVSNTNTTRNFRSHGKLNVKMTLKSVHDDDLHGRLARLAGDAVSTLAEVPD